MAQNVCQPLQTSHSYIYLGFYYEPQGDLIIKPSFPLEFLGTFCLICKHSFAYSVECFSMPADLQSVSIHTVVETTSLLIQTHYNHTGTTPTSCHKVSEPCIQTLKDMVGTQWWNGAWHYTQTSKHSYGLANWVFDLLAHSTVCNSVSHKVNCYEDYMVQWWIVLHHKFCTVAL